MLGCPAGGCRTVVISLSEEATDAIERNQAKQNRPVHRLTHDGDLSGRSAALGDARADGARRDPRGLRVPARAAAAAVAAVPAHEHAILRLVHHLRRAGIGGLGFFWRSVGRSLWSG